MTAERKTVEKLVADSAALLARAAQSRAESAKLQAEIEAAISGDTFTDATAASVGAKRLRVEHLTAAAKKFDAEAAALMPQIDAAVNQWRQTTLDALDREGQQVAAEVAKFFRRWMPETAAADAAVGSGPVGILDSIKSGVIYGGTGDTPTERFFKQLVALWDRHEQRESFMPEPS